MKKVNLTREPARLDLSDRECAKLLGGNIGVLMQMAEPNAVRRAVKWWAEQPESTWERLDRQADEINRAMRPPLIAPHAFTGRLDRRCDVCGRSDRDPVHDRAGVGESATPKGE